MRFRPMNLLSGLLLLWLASPLPQLASAQVQEAIVHTVTFPTPEKNVAEVRTTFPTGGRDHIDLMMALWSPGFYRMEDYAAKIQELTAQSPDGKVLQVEQPAKNRWRIQTGGAAAVVVAYKLVCKSGSVTTNWVGPDFAVLNGGATFLTLVEKGPKDLSQRSARQLVVIRP